MMYLKGAAKLFIKQKSIAPLSKLFNEILCILVGKGAAIQWEVKLGGPKNVSTCLGCHCIHLAKRG